MNELELKMRTNAILHDTIESFRLNNNIPAHIIIDVLKGEIVNLYPMMQKEYLAQLDEAKAALEQMAMQETEEKETE